MNDSLAQRVGWVLWPAFLVACAAELVFFSLFDPTDLHLFGQPVELTACDLHVGLFRALGARAACRAR